MSPLLVLGWLALIVTYMLDPSNILALPLLVASAVFFIANLVFWLASK